MARPSNAAIAARKPLHIAVAEDVLPDVEPVTDHAAHAALIAVEIAVGDLKRKLTEARAYMAADEYDRIMGVL